MKPGRGPGSERGAVLAMAVVLGGVLAILVTAVYVIFQSNSAHWRYNQNRVRAEMAAEAGVSLAMHTLELESTVPAGSLPFSMPGDSAQWMSLPSGDQVWVVIDPSDQNDLPLRIGAVEIRARGMSRGVVRDVCVRACPEYPSMFALLTDDGVPSGFLEDGCRLGGALHSNGPIHFSSVSPDSSEDPWVASATTTGAGGFYFCDAGRCDEPHPEGSRVWVRPYMRHRQGKPYWSASADSVSFQRLRDWFGGLDAEAYAQGSVIRGARRVLLDGDRVVWRDDPLETPDTLSLEGRSIVYLQSGFSPVYIKSIRQIARPLTLVSSGPLYIMGPISSSGASNGAPFAVVSMAGIWIAEDPDEVGTPDWNWPWNIDTNRHLTISAFVACPTGCLQAESPLSGSGGWALNITGGLLQKRMGTVGTPLSGYVIAVSWDEGYGSYHPPFFPCLERWRMTSWDGDPDYGERYMDDNMF